MRRLVAVGGLTFMLLASAQSEEMKPLVDALLGHMTATYMCRDALGGLDQYQAAHTLAIEVATRLIGADEGAELISDFEKQLQSDPKFEPQMDDVAGCNTAVSDGLEEIKLEQSRLGLL